MKPFNLSVAVIIMLAFLFIQEDPSGLMEGIRQYFDLSSRMSDISKQCSKFVLFTQAADNKRQKRHSGPCKFCCNCCGHMNFCGFCCEWRF
uniref:Uncharacterized protein n=1 Tax=Hippocampus comes TaxID=109280 RepID=A0A3Q2XTV5_HIPCM